MNDINPNNYLGATVTVVGYAAGEASAPKWDKDQSSGRLEISVPVNEGYKKDGTWVTTGTTWYTYSASGQYADALRAVSRGDKLRIDGAKLEGREYQKNDGSTGYLFNLSYGNLSILEKSDGSPTRRDESYIPAPTAKSGW